MALTSMLAANASVVKLHVVDTNGNLLNGAVGSCILLPDSICDNVVITDESGYFEWDAPDCDWYIILNHEGYKQACFTKRDYTKAEKWGLPINIMMNPDLPDLKERQEPDHESKELREVVVKATKGAMSMKDGIISFKNLNEIMKTRVISSAHELLLALPLISSTDGNNLKLAGAPLGSVIYINGRPSQMNQTTLMDYLKGIPPQMVEDIEIIYSPSPKWKTRSSVINVRLKRKSEYTFNGQVQASGSWKHAFSGRAGTSLFLGLPKLNVNAGYFFNSGKGIAKEVSWGRHTVGNSVTEVLDTAVSRTLANSHNVFALVDYEINKSNSLAINYNGQFSPKSDNNLYSENSIYGLYNSKTKSDSHFNAVSVSYSNKNGIDAGIEYSHFSADRNQEILCNSISEKPALSGNSGQTVNRAKAYVDFNTQLKRGWRLLYGASYAFIRNDNRLVNISDDPTMESDDIATETTEQIANAYLGFQKSFLGEKISVSAFMKGEHYRMDNYKRTQLLPSTTITYIPSYTHIFQVSYQSFKNYPSLWQRQDYKSYSNPYQLSEGNANLKPASYNVASLLYMFRQKYTLSLSYYRVNGFFLNQSFQSPDALVLVSKPYNIDYSSTLDMTLTIPVNIGKIFYSNITVNAALDKFKSSDWHNLSFNKSRLTGGVMADNTVIIFQKPKVSINLTGMYKLPCYVGLWERGHAWLLNAAISGAFFNESLTVSFKGFDLLQTLCPVNRIRLNTQCMDVNDNFYSTYFSLNIAFNFKGYKNKTQKTYDTSRYGFE